MINNNLGLQSFADRAVLGRSKESKSVMQQLVRIAMELKDKAQAEQAASTDKNSLVKTKE